jgi:enoyl-CoA hydratase/carnithine racemase
MKAHVLHDIEGRVHRLTLNDPASRNSLSEAMMEELIEELGGIASGVIILAAAGPMFCSGHNVKEMTARRADSDGGEAYFTKLFSKCADLMLQITRHPCPIIAEVDGLATAAGCQLVASCDIAIATERAGFCTPGVNIGLFCSTPVVAISRAIGRKHAMEMLLTGDIIQAADAHRMGLINQVVSHNELRRTTAELAQKIASKSPAAIAYGKAAFDEQMGMPMTEAYALMARVMTENMLHREAKEGIGAIIEQRAPRWTQKG